jgi:cytidylate kinase
MNHTIVCIGREFGSGGHEIAVRTGQKLGIRVYEKDLFHLACRYGELSEKWMESADEAATNPFLFRTVHEGNHHVTRGLPTSEVLFQLQSHEIRRIAAREDCIFVGRCADFVLQTEDVKLLRIFIRAPMEKRIERKMCQEGLSREKAAHLVRKMDRQRKKYYETYTGKTWGDSQMWDVTIDTGSVSLDYAADIICALYHHVASGVQMHPSSQEP